LRTFIFDSPNQEWLEKRKQFVTGTELAALFNIGGTSSLSKVFQDKLNPVTFEKNKYMLHGNILEPAVLEAFYLLAGIDAEKYLPGRKVFMAAHAKHQLSVSLDGKAGEFIVECKTTGSDNPERAKLNFDKWDEHVPLNYLLQVQAQLLVTGAPKAYIGCLGYNYPGRVTCFIAYEVFPNAELHEIILKAVKAFWKCFHEDLIYEISPETKKRVKELLLENQALLTKILN